MRLAQQIQFKRNKLLDYITFLSKNLYNVTTYTVRQRFFKDRHWTRYYELWTLLKNHETYKKLQNTYGSHPPQQVLKQVDKNFKSFFKAIKSWKKNPKKFQGRPKLPKYKQKNGKNIIHFTSLQTRMKNGYVLLTNKIMKLGFPELKTRQGIKSVEGVRVVPFGDRYNIELIYKQELDDLELDKNNVMGVDLGLTNIVTISDNKGEQPLIIKGGVLKSINQYYNKKLAKYKSIIKKCNKKYVTNQILKIHRKRNNKINDFFHKTSHKLINHCIEHNIGKVVIGYNVGWKQNINIGKRNNQTFVQVPFLKFVQQVEYKTKLLGIDMVRVSEEFTSQTCSNCGVVDKSNRKHRGLYVCSKCGLVLNADVNASKNILKKGVPESESVWIGDRGFLDRPVVVKII
ncbi:MAG: RNA-guided endonuclease InsQ/TnpB family protein [Candidatus Ranarchaeia archaeon]